MSSNTSEEIRSQIVNLVRDFVKRDVEPVVDQYDEGDTYPRELVDKMAEIGLFGITIPGQYGGLGLDYTTFAVIFEELSKGWMSITGPIGTHHVMSYIISTFGTEEQKLRLLPKMARGEIRGGLALTEPDVGSDIQNIQLSATKNGNEYVLNGSKSFITNGEYGNAFVVVVKTHKKANPVHKGISCFIVEKPTEGFYVGTHLDKLGYRGSDTCELIFEDCRITSGNLVGGHEGRGFEQVLNGLEIGRVNIAARAVGIATAAFESAMRYAQQRKTFGVPIAQHQIIQAKLADMATKIEAARLLTHAAATKKNSSQRVDLEAGMAKLFASEVCGEVTLEAMRIHGGYGYVKDNPVQRYYRDAPFTMIAEGTNEIQRLIIARRLLEKYKI